MVAYYNEIDRFAAEWLRQLINAGHISPGDVDERSIEDVKPDDLRPYTQCHFFAGIGIWSHALRLIKHGKPYGIPVFGEQVSSGGGNIWIDTLQNDMAGIHHEVWALDIPAASIGAPHIRQRWLWVAHSASGRFAISGSPLDPWGIRYIDFGGRTGRLVDTVGERGCGGESGSQDAGDAGQPIEACRLANTNGWNANTERIPRLRGHGQQSGDDGALRNGVGGIEHSSNAEMEQAGPVNGHWRNADWLFCRDGSWRPVESGTFPLVNGTPSRVGRMRGYGNGIVATQAQAFIAAYMEVKDVSWLS